MAITSITIENFKGIGDAVTIPIRPITLLFGKNSSGKSTVLQALHYTREVWEHGGADADRTSMGGNYIDLGGFRSLVHLHDLNRKIRIRVEFDLTIRDSKKLNHLLNHETGPNSMWIEAVTSWDAKRRNVCTELYSRGLNGTEWIRIYPMKMLDTKSSNTIDPNGAKWHRLSKGSFLNSKHPYSKHPITGDYLEMLERALSILNEISKKELYDIRYLGPIRELPDRDYCPQRTPDESLWAEGLEAWNTLGRNPQLINPINDYMLDVLKLGYSISRKEIISLDRAGEIMENIKKICTSKNKKIEPNELKKQVYDPIEQLSRQIMIKLHDKKNGVDLDAADVGLGISQVIPVLVGALHHGVPDPNRYDGSQIVGKFFVVEQPELHLHPAAQVALSDVFIDSIKYNCPYHNIQATLKKIRDNEKSDDSIRELFEIMQENRGHPGIQSAMERYLRGENINLDDIQSVIEKSLKRGESSNPDIQLFFEELSYSINSIYRTILIETHSEHLLLRLLRRVHETSSTRVDTKYRLTPDDLSVVYVQPTPTGSKFTPVSVTDDGDFDEPWPEGFFEERDSELFYHA